MFLGEAPTERKIAISRLRMFKPAIVIDIIPNKAIKIIKAVIILNALSTLPVNCHNLDNVIPGITAVSASGA